MKINYELNEDSQNRLILPAMPDNVLRMSIDSAELVIEAPIPVADQP